MDILSSLSWMECFYDMLNLLTYTYFVSLTTDWDYSCGVKIGNNRFVIYSLKES